MSHFGQLEIVSLLVGWCLTNTFTNDFCIILSPHRFPTILRIRSLPSLDPWKSPHTSEYTHVNQCFNFNRFTSFFKSSTPFFYYHDFPHFGEHLWWYGQFGSNPLEKNYSSIDTPPFVDYKNPRRAWVSISFLNSQTSNPSGVSFNSLPFFAPLKFSPLLRNCWSFSTSIMISTHQSPIWFVLYDGILR